MDKIFTLCGLMVFLIPAGCSGEETGEHARQVDPTTETPDSEQIDKPEVPGESNEADAETEPNVRIQFVRETTYGSNDNLIIGVIGAISVDESSRVFLADRDQTTIQVFEPDGSYLTSLGRQGEGPGEFTAINPNTSMVIHSGRLYVTDLADSRFFFPHRINLFSLDDLSFIRTINLLAVNRDKFEDLDGHYSKMIYPLSDGTFLVSYHRSSHDYRDEESFVYYVIQDERGSIISSPVLKQKDLTYLVYDVPDAPFRLTVMHSFPIYGKSLLAVSSDDYLYAVANTEEFKIDIYTPDGDHVRKIEHFFENRSFNRNEILDYYEKTNYGHRLGEGVALNMIREAKNLPEIWPAIEDMLIDDEDLNHLAHKRFQRRHEVRGSTVAIIEERRSGLQEAKKRRRMEAYGGVSEDR
jgi:hypothetical protein